MKIVRNISVGIYKARTDGSPEEQHDGLFTTVGAAERAARHQLRQDIDYSTKYIVAMADKDGKPYNPIFSVYMRWNSTEMHGEYVVDPYQEIKISKQ